MRKLFIPLLATFFIAAMTISSCKREEFTEENALAVVTAQDSIDQYYENLRDSLNHLGGVIEYSINVVDASDGAFTTKSTEEKSGLDACEVTVSQHGLAQTITTGSSGIAVFSDLRIGTVNVSIKKEGYTNVDFIAELHPEKDTIVTDTIVTIDYYEILRYAATMVPVFNVVQPSASTIEGQITYESDLTNYSPEYMGNAEVIASIEVDDPSFKANYITPINSSYKTGQIVQIAYSSVVFRTTTDNSGNFTLDVPSTADGLPIRINVSDFATTQTLLMNTLIGQATWGKQNVRAIFSSYHVPSQIPIVPAAYVTFSSPTGTPAEAPDVAAAASAVLTSTGIESVNISIAGSFYTQTPVLRVTGGNGSGAKVSAVLTNGRVTEVIIDNPGSGYRPDDIISVSEDPQYSPTNVTAEAVVNYSIISYNVTNAALNIYNTSTPPNVVVTAPAGSGATAMAEMTGFVDDIELISGGSGFICTPEIIIESSPTGDNADDATASLNMTDFNPLFGIDYVDATPAKFESTPVVEIRTPVGRTGGGATAIAVLKTFGNVKQINLINPGSGYSLQTPPAVYITGGDGTGATAYATVAADGTISAIIMGDLGFGYTSTNPPTVTIAAPPSGGTTATASLVLEFELDRIELTNPGSGYNVTYNNTAGTNANTPSVTLNGTALTADTEVLVYPNMSVESVDIPSGSGGRAYETAPSVQIIPVCGSGSGAQAQTSLKWRVNKVLAVTKGSGYKYQSDIQVSVQTPPEGCPVQARVTPKLGEGILIDIILNDGGMNYTAAPMVKLKTSGGNDMGPVITAAVSDGSVVGFTISDGTIIRNYDEPSEADPATLVVDVDYFTNAATFTARANPLSGQIEFVQITIPGQGYKSVPIVEFVRSGVVSSGDFVNAIAEAVVEDGRVVSINVLNPGSGYYRAPTVNLVVRNYVETAKGSCTIDYNTGRITGVDFTVAGTTKGAGYLIATEVTFSANLPGFGDGAIGIAVIDNGRVDRVIMTNQGQAYLGKNRWVGSSYTVTATLPLPNTGTTAGATMTAGVEGAVIKVVSGKNYVRDLYMGTGYRPVNQ